VKVEYQYGIRSTGYFAGGGKMAKEATIRKYNYEENENENSFTLGGGDDVVPVNDRHGVCG
jgi:hypothetical protein